MGDVRKCAAECWKITIIVILLLLLTALVYVGDIRAQITEDEVDFEVLATVTMRKGNEDSLWNLAKKYYGDPYQWTFIRDMNRIPNERVIPVGTVIYVPVKGAKKLAKEVEVKEKEAAEEELSAEIARLRKELRGVKGKNKELARSLKECEDRNRQLTREMKNKDARIKELEAEARKMREMQAAARRKDARIKELEGKVREMQAAAEAAARENESLEARIRQSQDLESQLRRHRREIEELEEANRKLNDRIRRTEVAGERSPQEKPREPVKKEPKESVDPKSRIAVVAILLLGTIAWMASD